MTRDISGRSRPPVSSAWPIQSSPFVRDAIKTAGLMALAAATGAIGWNGSLLTLPLAFAFPVLWANSPSRIAAGIVSAGYFLAASRGLPQGVVNYFGSGIAEGLALWLGASLAFVAVHAVLWTSRPGTGRTLRYAAAAILMSVPPFGIVGWAHPITAAGIVFPGWGWWGLVAAAIGLLAMTTKFWPIATLVWGGAFAWSAATWTEPSLPQGWIGVDTKFGGERGTYAGLFQHRETIAAVKAAAAQGNKIVVLPEGAAGVWTPTVERLWVRELKGVDVTVNAGAILVDGQGYDNVMVEISGEGARILYRERMPVPISMWQPWLTLIGESGGARAHFFANPIVETGGVRLVPLICYEQLIVWPVLQSALYAPDIIVATGNGWWTDGTSIVAIQKSASIAWARLFDLPLIMAFNI
ncbi:conjugal transfer protein TraB [Chelativorans intermedius]|uniref:Conjugal transfer protein TraB n=1 Tax=Chelativorans intermedius TaxID=515947 RepID=A0ABV6DCB9_9HYPH|nr:conjugal transfer protein TraB [Chelativorans intermedius]MCT9000382.1 conjugal transfer protein TraB [Chelativorans intermedius]